jgi:hypothetical protein
MGKTLFSSFDYFDEAPAFVLAERTGLHNSDGVSDIAIVFLIVSHELGGFLNEFTILGVFHLTFHHDDDGFFHLVAHHNTDSLFS